MDSSRTSLSRDVLESGTDANVVIKDFDFSETLPGLHTIDEDEELSQSGSGDSIHDEKYSKRGKTWRGDSDGTVIESASRPSTIRDEIRIPASLLQTAHSHETWGPSMATAHARSIVSLASQPRLPQAVEPARLRGVSVTVGILARNRAESDSGWKFEARQAKALRKTSAPQAAPQTESDDAILPATLTHSTSPVVPPPTRHLSFNLRSSGTSSRSISPSGIPTSSSNNERKPRRPNYGRLASRSFSFNTRPSQITDIIPESATAEASIQEPEPTSSHRRLSDFIRVMSISNVRKTSMHELYQSAKAKALRLQRKPWAQKTFEYSMYFLLALFIYFLFVGLPIWNGAVWWLWSVTCAILVRA